LAQTVFYGGNLKICVCQRHILTYQLGSHLLNLAETYCYRNISYVNRHSATSRKVAGSIPDGVIRIFHWHNPSGRTMALELAQPLKEMSTRNISWGIKAVGAYG